MVIRLEDEAGRVGYGEIAPLPMFGSETLAEAQELCGKIGDKVTVKAGRSRFSLPTLPRDDFPVIVEGDLPTSFELPAATLAQLIDRTRFAISTEETRYYLNGIFFHVADDVLKAAATDGHRLARRGPGHHGAAAQRLGLNARWLLSTGWTARRIGYGCAGGSRPTGRS